MIDFASIIFGIFIGVVLAILLIYLYIRGLVHKVMDEVDQMVAVAQSQMMPVTVERESGQIYCYAKEGRQFICQGATLAEVRAAFQARYPDRTAYLDGGDSALVEELRSELKKDIV
jgi:exopolysaccharide biosynthesis protein